MNLSMDSKRTRTLFVMRFKMEVLNRAPFIYDVQYTTVYTRSRASTVCAIKACSVYIKTL